LALAFENFWKGSLWGKALKKEKDHVKRERERRGDLGDGVAEFFGMSGVVSSHSDDLSPRCQ
jgi:hypothetical protein